jgi:insulysin
LFCSPRQTTDFGIADEDVKQIEPLKKADVQKAFADHISPSSLHRAKLSVHLIAQAKPKEPSAEEKVSTAIAKFTTILKAETITPDLEKLKARLTDPSILEAAITAHVTEDLKLEKAQADKILDEAKAALGLAELEKKLEHIQVLEDGDVEHKVAEVKKGEPVLIRDVHAWKVGLQMSTGVRPVRDLADFLEGSAKL